MTLIISPLVSNDMDNQSAHDESSAEDSESTGSWRTGLKEAGMELGEMNGFARARVRIIQHGGVRGIWRTGGTESII